MISEKDICVAYLSGKSGRECSKTYNVSVSTVQRILNRNFIKKRSPSECKKKYKRNSDYFEKINSPDKAYFLGLLFSDGTVSKRSMVINLQDRDKPVLEKFKNYIEYSGPLGYLDRNNINHQNTSILRIYDYKLVSDLNKLGCVGNKTYILKFPKIPKKLESHFIRGIFDGDGAINKYGNYYRFSITGLNSFIKEINNKIVKACGIDSCTISVKNSGKEDFVAIQYSKKNTLKRIRDYLYKDCKDLYIDRKKAKFDSI